MRTDRYALTVDYDRSFAALVDAGGYDHVNECLTESSFPVEGRGVVATELALVCLERTGSTDEVLRTLESSRLRPGRIAELLSLGDALPQLQRRFPIVALGSVAGYPHEYRRIPFLWGSERVRHLDLRWDEHSWPANIRFLAVDAAAQAADPPSAPAATGAPEAISARASSRRP